MNQHTLTRQKLLNYVSWMSEWKGKLIFAVLFAVLGFLCTILIPYSLVILALKSLQGENISYAFLAFFILIGILRGVFRYGEHYFGHYIAFKVLADLRIKIFHQLRELAPAKLDQQDSGNLLKLIGEDIEAIEVFFAHTIPPVSTAIAVSILLGSYYIYMSPSLAAIALLSYVCIAIGIPRIFARRISPVVEEQTQIRKNYTNYFLESLKGMKDLVQFKVANDRFNYLQNLSQSVNDKELQVTKINFFQTVLTFFTLGMFSLLFVLMAYVNVEHQVISFESGILAVVVYLFSFAPYLELSRLPLGFKRAIVAAERVHNLLKEVAESKNEGEMLEPPIEKIAIQGISFRYPNRNVNVLHDVSFSVTSPKIIGIIGESGSGKSTLMKLVLRWFQPTSGNIQINELPMAIHPASLQNHIAYIPQNPYMFSDTIRENLILGKTHISDEAILAACEKCRMKDVILRLEQGLDTILNPEQAIFSQGELQRLELIRALLKGANCYIFDEPTSNLDSLNEATLLQVIKKECQGIVFLISHRRSTVALADEIYRCENQTFIKER